MAIGDMLRASGGFRRGQWTGRNPNSSPLFNQFSSQQQDDPWITKARAAGWRGPNPNSQSSASDQARDFLRKIETAPVGPGPAQYPSTRRPQTDQWETGSRAGESMIPPQPQRPRSFQDVLAGNTARSGSPIVGPGPAQYPSTRRQQPDQWEGVGQDWPRGLSADVGGVPVELQGSPGGVIGSGGPQGPQAEKGDRWSELARGVHGGIGITPDEASRAMHVAPPVTGTSPNMGMEQFRSRMGAAGFDLNAPTPPQTMIGGSGVPADVRKKIFRDEMDQRIRGKDLWTGMGIGESAGGQGPPSVERLTQEAEAPLSFWQKAGGFFKKPEVSSAMIATGGKMMEAAGQPGATVLGSLGTGLQAGQETAQKVRQEGRLNTQLEQQTELFNRQITAEDLSIKREEERRKAYESMFVNGEFSDEGFADAMRIALRHGDSGFATALIQMRPQDLPMQYEIRSLYNEEKGVNEDYLLKIDPDQGIIDRDYIGISEFDTGGGTTAAMTEMNRGLGEIAADALEGMLEGDIDYYMAGARPDGQGGWTEGSLGNLAGWESIFADYISAGGGEVEGLARKVFGAGWREVIDERAQRGFTEAYNFINPVVRYLSGAQMTNQEAMRYYTALMPKPNDRMSVLALKRRKRQLLAAAMKGDTAAIERLGVDMSHHSNLMGGEWATIDPDGTQRMDLILGALDNAVGQTDYYDWSTDPGGAMGTDLVIN